MQTSKKTNSVHVVLAQLAHSKIFFLEECETETMTSERR